MAKHVLNIQTGEQLGPQLFVHTDEPTPEMVTSPHIPKAQAKNPFDPFAGIVSSLTNPGSNPMEKQVAALGQFYGGFWTAPIEYEPDGTPTSSYVTKMLLTRTDANPRAPRGRWRLCPKSDAKVLVVDSRDDFRLSLGRFGYYGYKLIDPVKVRRAGFAAIYVTQRGIEQNKALWNWLIPSVQWLSWAFEGEPELMMDPEDHACDMEQILDDPESQQRLAEEVSEHWRILHGWPEVWERRTDRPLPDRTPDSVELYMLDDPDVSAPALADVANNRWLEEVGIPAPPSLAQGTEEGVRRMVEHPSTIVVAAIDSQKQRGFVGVMVGGSCSESHSIPGLSDPERTASIYQLYIGPNDRRRGIGRALVNSALKAADASGSPYVALDVPSDNPAAVAFAKRLGFRKVGPVSYATDKIVQTWMARAG